MDNVDSHTNKKMLLEITEGDVSAFKQLFIEMHTALYILAKRLVVNEELAKDIVSDIFLQVWESRVTLTSIKDIRAYLYVATRNRSLKYLKKEKQVAGLEAIAYEAQWDQQASDTFLQSLYDTETTRILQEAVQSLPGECKKVITLSLEGFSTNEIAEQLGVSASAVSNQKARAVKLLRGKLPLPVLLLCLCLLDQTVQ